MIGTLEFWQTYPHPLPRYNVGCGIHGNEFIWQSIHGAQVCGACHPAVSPDVVLTDGARRVWDGVDQVWRLP